tara:strand:- start:5510 stop:6280 length:771 start_codon:yes stop_codon:yes gene_type:complete
MKIILFSIMYSILWSSPTNAKEDVPQSLAAAHKEIFKSKSIGHILTPNTNVLQKGELSAGSLYLGYGATDSLTVATSPFLYLSYGMHNLFLRLSQFIDDSKRLAFELGYYKSFGHSYQMEASSAKATFSIESPLYRFNLSTSVYSYFDDTRPFSLRMEPYNSDTYSLNLSTLHEFALRKNLFLNFEIGSLGLNYHYPYLHLGTSVAYQFEKLFVGLGASVTTAPQIPPERSQFYGSVDQTWKNSQVHPEIQLQYFF